MKIFMSWSGQRSHAAAEVIGWWVSCVIQASRPWISSVDVDRGTLWFSEITNVLADTSVGIVCLTHENKNRPWILFEVGALAKGLSTSRVCTFLCDLDPHDIQDPLAQFNHTKPDKDGMKKLARTLNGVLGANGLDPNVLNDACDTYWPQFKVKYAAAMETFPLAGPVEVRSKDDVLEEILDSVRGMNQRVRQLEHTSIPGWDDNQSISSREDAVISTMPLAPQVGQGVHHAKFGLGKVIKIEHGKNMTRAHINFINAGMKVLDLSVAKLHIVLG